MELHRVPGALPRCLESADTRKEKVRGRPGRTGSHSTGSTLSEAQIYSERDGKPCESADSEAYMDLWFKSKQKKKKNTRKMFGQLQLSWQLHP